MAAATVETLRKRASLFLQAKKAGNKKAAYTVFIAPFFADR